jgi:hypothetical protein
MYLIFIYHKPSLILVAQRGYIICALSSQTKQRGSQRPPEKKEFDFLGNGGFRAGASLPLVNVFQGQRSFCGCAHHNGPPPFCFVVRPASSSESKGLDPAAILLLLAICFRQRHKERLSSRANLVSVFL